MTKNTESAHSKESEETGIVDSLIDEIRERQWRGKLKYNATMDRTDLSPYEWLQHAKEEALDLAVYLHRILRDERLPEGGVLVRQASTATKDGECKHRWRRVVPIAQEQCSYCKAWRYPQCNHPASPWNKTSERPPTREDADKRGFVWVREKISPEPKTCSWQNARSWPYWTRIPALPVLAPDHEANGGGASSP